MVSRSKRNSRRSQRNNHQESKMSATNQPAPAKKKWLSIDTWAVVLALAAALLIRAGILTHIPW
jgi:hypothetical protein